MATIFGLNIKLRNERWPRAESFYHMYVYKYVCMYVCMYVNLYICINMYLFL